MDRLSLIHLSNELWPAITDFRELMMFLDTVTYLPGDILTKVDRASMSIGLKPCTISRSRINKDCLVFYPLVEIA